MKIKEAIALAAEELERAEIPEPAREASSLMQFALARDRAFIFAHPEYELTRAERELYERSVRRRGAREPFQHVVGRQEFYGLDFIVTPDVLIPRHETELIVEKAVELLTGSKSPRFFEIGIGSGCISIAILKNCPYASALAVDISRPAIDVALHNASMHSVAGRLEVIESDVYENVDAEQFELIVANPPYVPLSEYAHLQPEVRDFDPRVAVTDGSTGLSIIERIVDGAPEHLSSGTHLLMEIGFDQHKRVANMFDPAKWNSPEFIRDLQQIPRVVYATRR